MPKPDFQEFDLWSLRDFDVSMTSDDRRETAIRLRELLGELLAVPLERRHVPLWYQAYLLPRSQSF